jgi:hypothetical protein
MFTTTVKRLAIAATAVALTAAAPAAAVADTAPTATASAPAAASAPPAATTGVAVRKSSGGSTATGSWFLVFTFPTS